MAKTMWNYKKISTTKGLGKSNELFVAWSWFLLVLLQILSHIFAQKMPRMLTKITWQRIHVLENKTHKFHDNQNKSCLGISILLKQWAPATVNEIADLKIYQISVRKSRVPELCWIATIQGVVFNFQIGNVPIYHASLYTFTK